MSPVIIDQEQEFTRDWDWYALDQDGRIGHFTSAGLRSLPNSVKKDRGATELVARYFFDQAPVIGGWSFRPAAEKDCGEWKKAGEFERYIKDFALMSSRGLFSFDTELLHGKEGRYYLVAIPERPLLVHELPPNIRELISHTTAPLQWPNCSYIAGPITEDW